MSFDISGTNAWQAVTFTNNTASRIPIYGLAWNGPFDFNYRCGADGNSLDPYGKCTLWVYMKENAGTPAGYHAGEVAFRVATGNIEVDLAGFVYSLFPKTGTKNLVDSLTTLGLPAASVDRLRPPAVTAKKYIWDAYASNDKNACAYVRTFIDRAEQEAAANRITDWEALVLIKQAQEVLTQVRCCNR
ncbi:hypothetical protein GCM10007067_25310 [Lysobacter bugurensis]|uniref:Uncharacterized protein n=2 Tax=Cognatilysobacter bugurensis TaxID=543356 RepID=A0A918W9S2_9GAMM|nr:hypothetical protein GCM10007067_25310 [Lysobacter bugurensis]